MAPFVTPTMFTKSLAHRVERQCVSDWTAIPIVRSVWFKYTVEHIPLAVTGFALKRGRSLEGNANEYTEAMRKLYKVLHTGLTAVAKAPNGVVRCKSMPIAGDITKLPYAAGLSSFERHLAHKVANIATHMPGTPNIRLMMGHCHFGARICHGDTLFITVSPNPEHSALLLRLSRARANDPLLQGVDEVTQQPRVEGCFQKLFETHERKMTLRVHVDIQRYTLCLNVYQVLEWGSGIGILEYGGRVFGIPACIVCGRGCFRKYVPGNVARGSHQEHDWERWGR